MKMQNKKRGFTIVELIIVIAVIGILAGVLVPTFSGVVGKAKKAAAQQEAASAYQMLLTEEGEANDMFVTTDEPDLYIVVGDYVFTAENGTVADAEVDAPATGYTSYKTIGKAVVYKK